MSKSLKLALSGAALAALAACSGGSGGSVPTAQPPAASSPKGEGTLSLTFRFPQGNAASAAASRRAQYLSYGTQSVVLVLAGNGGAPSTIAFNITPTSTGCTESTAAPTLVCTTNLYAPIGTDTISVTAYDTPQAPNATGNFVGKVLGSVSNVQATVVAGTNTPVNISLGGNPASSLLVLSPPSAPVGTATHVAVNVLAYDADGYLIVGTYSAPVAISDSDASATTLSTATANASNAGVQLNYTGTALPTPATITSTIGTKASGTATFTSIAAATHAIVFAGTGGVTGAYDLANEYPLGTAGNTFQADLLYVPGASINFAVGPGNEVVDAGDSNAAGLNYYAPFPIPAPSTNPVPRVGAPTSSVTYKNSYGSTPSGAAFSPSGQLYAFYDLGLGSNGPFGDQYNINTGYPDFSNGALPPPLSFLLSDALNYGFQRPVAKFDAAGNLWAVGYSALDEYSAASLASVQNGATIQPITQIAYSTLRPPNTAPPSIRSASDIAFDAQNNIYVIGSGSYGEVPVNGTNEGTIFGFPASVRGTTTTESSAVLEFQTKSIGFFTEFAIEPSTSYLVVLTSTGLAYFPSIGQSPPAVGATNVMPFKTVQLNGGGTSGALVYAH